METKNKHIDLDQLVNRYQNGDEQALRQLIKEFHPKLLQQIRYQTNDDEAVEDLAQECWYQIIPKLKTLQLKISFEAWALTIARRRSIDWIREQQRQRTQQAAVDTENKKTIKSGTNNDDQHNLEKIKMGIQQLPKSQKIVLELFYQENLSLIEICEVLDLPKGTVKSRLFYAREGLKEIINKNNEAHYENRRRN